jgi:WhiB family redox-sensing transcriptional regulator
VTSTLRDSPPAPSWAGAACHGHDPELWFPHESGWGTAREAHEAKAVCAICPVRSACAAYAIPIVDLSGVWAGLTAGDRRRIRDERAGGVCLCGCALVDHRIVSGSVRRRRGRCRRCDCDEYVGV